MLSLRLFGLAFDIFEYLLRSFRMLHQFRKLAPVEVQPRDHNGQRDKDDITNQQQETQQSLLKCGQRSQIDSIEPCTSKFGIFKDNKVRPVVVIALAHMNKASM